MNSKGERISGQQKPTLLERRHELVKSKVIALIDTNISQTIKYKNTCAISCEYQKAEYAQQQIEAFKHIKKLIEEHV